MSNQTIAILSAGEMGSAIGRLLSDAGHTIITTVEGRSARTIARCESAGFRLVPTRAAALEEASIVWSFIHPRGAVELLAEALEVLSRRAGTASAPIFVDGNSIAPKTAARLAASCAERGVDFVDASIHGTSSQLRERSVLYLGGARAEEIAASFGGSMRVRNLGTDPTLASRFKMTIAGVSKGASALLMEVALVASEQGILDEWLEDCRHFYPGLMGRMETMLPTYAHHAGRRATELAEMEETVRDLGLRPGLIAEARRLVSRLAEEESALDLEGTEPNDLRLDAFLAALSGTSLLQRSTTSTDEGTSPPEPTTTHPHETISSDREERTDETSIS